MLEGVCIPGQVYVSAGKCMYMLACVYAGSHVYVYSSRCKYMLEGVCIRGRV